MKYKLSYSRIIPVLFLTVSSFSFAEESGHLSEEVDLFGSTGAPPIVLESERGWTPISAFDWSESEVLPIINGENRRWRLESTYEHGRAGGPVTLQIRLRGAAGSPVFTHPWSEGADRTADAYSNWFEDEEGNLATVGRGYIEARLISPPRTPVSGKLFSVTLEAWDSSLTTPLKRKPSPGPEVNLAYVRPLPTESPSLSSRADADAEDISLGIKAAQTFALGFVESCLTGDLPSYYRAHSDPVRSLDDGMAMARYRLSPPRGIPGITSLDDYKRRFDYAVHPVSEYRDLFPEWFAEDRDWSPGDGAYLFMGHRDRMSGAFPDGVDYLVFIVEADESGDWKVVARPGN